MRSQRLISKAKAKTKAVQNLQQEKGSREIRGKDKGERKKKEQNEEGEKTTKIPRPFKEQHENNEKTRHSYKRPFFCNLSLFTKDV